MVLAEVLKGGGEPTRLRLLNLLRQGDICVCDLQAVLSLPQHTVSRHLAALRHAGLVVDQRKGQRVIYSLAMAATSQVQSLRELLDKCCEAEAVFRKDLTRLKRLLREGECSLVKEAQHEERTAR